jgi:hypothetical protein
MAFLPRLYAFCGFNQGSSLYASFLPVLNSILGTYAAVRLTHFLVYTHLRNKKPLTSH